jgi:serine/threonine protein kinase/tetratricopeptide (TPR) repeat protein
MGESSAQTAKTPHEAEDLTGTTVGRFLIRARLGAGAMGEVYRADDAVLKRAVALKRITPALQADPYFHERFLKEAERASSLTHPRIAGIFDVLEDSRGTFLVMEYVEGQTLRQRISRPLKLEEFLPIAEQCAEALVGAHEKKIVHCDIKPENILLTPAGDVKVLDFGVAKRLPDTSGAKIESAESETQVSIGGTFLYMAPEVLLERAIDPRSDLFSLGVVFYEALSGRHPFRSGSPTATMSRILHEPPTPLSETNHEVPSTLNRIVERLLAKDRAARYQSAAELLADLHAFERGALPATAPALPHMAQRRAVPRRAWLLVTLAMALVLAGVFSWRHLRGGSRSFTERDWILISELENRSGEPLFDHTVSELVQSSLLQSSYVNVVPRVRAIEAARRASGSGVGDIDAALGREICRREHFRALLSGVVERAGAGYQISVRVLDPQSGVVVLTETEAFDTTAHVYAAADRLTRRLRKSLGEPAAQIEKNSPPLELLKPASLEAQERYSRATEAYARGEWQRAVDLASGALALDPNFAMAHLCVAKAQEHLGNLQATRLHMSQATQGIDRVSERERLLILAMDASVNWRYEKAAEGYRRLVELYPDDVEGHRGFAEASRWTDRLEDAIAGGRRALELDPHSPIDHARLLHNLNRLNRFRETLDAYQMALANGIQSSQLLWPAGLAYLGAGDTAAARRLFEQLSKSGTPYDENLAQLCLSRVLMYEGRVAEAAEALRTGLVLDEKMKSETWAPMRRYLLASVQLLRGRRDDARAAAQQLAASAIQETNPGDVRRAALLACQLRDLTSARRLLARLDALRKEQDSAYAKSSFHNVRAALEVAAGQPQVAVEEAHAALAFFRSFESYEILGEASKVTGDWATVADAHEQLLALKGQILMSAFPPDWVMAHLDAARAYSRLGQPRKAVVHYDEFLRLWAGADAELKIVREARAERDALAGSTANSPSHPLK